MVCDIALLDGLRVNSENINLHFLLIHCLLVIEQMAYHLIIHLNICFQLSQPLLGLDHKLCSNYPVCKQHFKCIVCTLIL